jgi:ribonuclease-3 family protein
VGKNNAKLENKNRGKPIPSEALKLLLDDLTPEEEAVFLRGRNAHVRTLPKNADPAKYHAATGLEAVFGALWLLGERERLNQLFDMMIDT